jgi:indole-3-glycerol phosphate synthase
MGILDRIVTTKRRDVEQDKLEIPMRRAVELASAAPPPRDFVAALRRDAGTAIIAEVRRPSPPAGTDPHAAGLGAVARLYEESGAAAISVLTDARFLHGAPGHLAEVKHEVAVPLLRKDFLFDEYQIYRSRALGADAILLISRILSAKDLRMMVGVTRSLHMEALVEAHSDEDLLKALDCGAAVVGVNNRNLDTMAVSIETSLRLASLLPPSVVKVSESGIESRSDVDRLRAAGYDACLVGEVLTRAHDPGEALRRLAAPETT